MLPPFDRTALLLDLDGTLIDFAPTPDSVIIPPDLPELLHRLKDRLDGALAIFAAIDGEPAGGFETEHGFVSFISWTGLDIGRDRSSPVSHYQSPFAFTGRLRKATFLLDDDQALDARAAAEAKLASE